MSDQAVSQGPAAARSVLALVDSSPVLLLPSLLACRERTGDRPLHVSLAGPIQSDAAMQRLAGVLGRHGIPATVLDRGPSLEETVHTWLNGAGADARSPLLDVSSASGGTATRAVLALQRDGRPYQLCWFHEANNEVHFSSGGAPEAHVIDVGSRRSVQSAVSPFDFMAIFGLERAAEDPYCGVGRQRLVPLATELLRVAMDHPAEYRQFRQILGAARAQTDCPIPNDAIPGALRPLIDELGFIEGWVRSDGRHTVFCGASDRIAVFFLSGGWLEVVVAEAIRLALPDHTVQTNCGATWGRRRRAEAEMDVAFVYHNALYLLSCKNDHLTDRFFPHLDRFRALTAEFGESRTRPVLLSTTELEPRHIRRCDAYEIGQISGRPLLELVDRSLREEPDALLKGLLTVSRGAPRAGLA
ncbi:MAG TPA: DUF1887 family CARF protein [Vicinamibacterales bacterium]|nr:DUF1887 family CARF protein [Vicinamibacterales bacterium]